MKKCVKYVGLLVLLAAMGFFFACKNKSSSPVLSKKTRPAAGRSVKAGEEKTIYTCPMHPGFTSDKPGECPICGMTLVPLKPEETKKEEKPQQPKKKIMYRSTMNPNEISDHPGKDSMGMEMVPFSVEEGEAAAPATGRVTVKITPELQQMIGVKTGQVQLQPIHKMVRTVGIVDYVEPNVAFVNLKFDGWIEKLSADATGILVKKGDPLFDIYSPDLVSSQKEYLLALKAKKSFEKTGGPGSEAAQSMLKSARERLRLWDISAAQIEELEKTGEARKTLTLYSPANGFIVEKNVLQGQKVMAGENLYKIADLTKVWIYGEIYEYQVPFVKKGQEVVISLASFPGETFSGRIAYIYPYLNMETRTNRVRIEVANRNFKLKPQMYANLDLHVEYGTKLAIPFDAVLDSGQQQIAFVDLGNGYLEPRELKLGVKGDNFYEVLSGVVAGDKVVTSANFLVDSESSLKAALSQMMQETEHKHD